MDKANLKHEKMTLSEQTFSAVISSILKSFQFSNLRFSLYSAKVNRKVETGDKLPEESRNRAAGGLRVKPQS